MPTTPEGIVRFWLEEVGPSGWYEVDEALDAKIRERFGESWEALRNGELETWRVSPEGALGYLILADQFPRNMFRGRPDAFATDGRARAAAADAIFRDWDRAVPEPERQFFYMPFVHSECLADQDRAICLFHDRMPEKGAGNLLHARAHREIIRRYSRFPFRNAALGRANSEAEAEFIESGGYPEIVRELQAETA
ncbi:DUF924 family protein [Ostreiculturibacter nitratireducens]|uniref:DUF924 family protein n=1 Tax=Ostreiculturibacter nitratireducens TaxID=3075226 RepID=UPI0031B5783B